MSYAFQSTLYRTRADMCRAMASVWLSADGLNNREDMLRFLSEASDAELAAKVVKEWGLDQPESPGWRDEKAQTWMQDRSVAVFDIEAAFKWLRANFDAEFPPRGDGDDL
jgi:hypothetical protein